MTINIEEILKERSKNIDKIIEKFIPRKFNLEKVVSTLGNSSWPEGYNIESLTKSVSEPFWDYLDRGGKRWRPVLFLLTYEAFGGKPEDVMEFVILPEMIHNATIIHDDIEDMSEERRGKPALHLMFGEDIAINVADILFFLPYLSIMKNKDKIGKEKALKAYEICLQECMRVGFGQATDIAWHKGLANADNISEEEYLQMCANKTGCIARMSTRLATALAGRSDKEIELMGKFSEAIGVAFQIQDDILNLIGEKFAERKGGAGEDITEGKRSLLVLYTLKKADSKDRKRFLEILGMHTTDQKLRDEAIEIMKKYDSIEYGKEKAKKIIQEAWKNIENILPQNDAKEKLKAFAYYLIERKI